jgi:hypothetical protein
MTTPSPHGLATVALLKARLDDQSDYLELFMPFVTDAIANISHSNFTVTDVQQTIQKRHSIAIPQYSLTILLKRLDNRRLIKRSAGIYLNLNKIKPSGIEAKKEFNERQNALLAEEFINFASQNNFQIESKEKALELIIDFLEDNKITILLGSNNLEQQTNKLSDREAKIVAEFVQTIIFRESNLKQILKDILEGLVVYNTATLREVNYANRNLKGLRVYLDSQFLFQLLGYEGEAQKILAIETVELLKKIGIQLLVFDRTINEMQRILKFYEVNIGNAKGIKIISENVMGRYFLSNRNTSSDIRQFSSLIFENLNRLGISSARMPKHVPQFTLDEKKLGEMLVNKEKGNPEEPRVIHDVNCAAAILTFRGNERSTNLPNSKYIFATSSFQVVSNVQRWYREEAEDNTISPFVHIRVLSNIAWLRKPELSTNLKIHELVTLCQTILQPSRKVWEMFLEHLNKLEKNKEITSDESVAIVVSEMTETMLGELGEDVDLSSIDEIIERVRTNYKNESERRIEEIKSESDLRITTVEFQAQQYIVDANKRAYKAARKADKLQKRLEDRAILLVKRASLILGILLHCVALIAALIFIFSQTTTFTLIGVFLLVITLVNFFLGLLGDVNYIKNIQRKVEKILLPYARRFTGAEANLQQSHISIFSSEMDEDN